MTKRGTYIYIKVDPELKKRLRIAAVQEDKNLTQLLTELAVQYLDEVNE